MRQTSFTIAIIAPIIFQHFFLVKVTGEPFLVRFARPKVWVSNLNFSEAFYFALDSTFSGVVLV